MLLWLLPLPLAIPTYLAAYVYVDLFEPLGLVHRTLAIWLPLQDAVRVLPNLRSLPGAIIVIALVLYPYVYLSARTMFQFQSAEFAEAAKTLGAGRWTTFWRISLPMARPALAVGVALVSLETLNDIGASEYLGVRTLTVSVFTTWLNRGSLAGAAQLVLLHAGDRGRPDRDRALRPPQRHDGVFRRKPAADAADAAYRHQGRLAHSRPACCRCCSDSWCRCCISRIRVSSAGCLRISTWRCGATPSTRSRSRALPR